MGPFACIAFLASNASGITVVVDGNSPGRTFQGIGMVSAGGTSDLLMDYPEPYRSDVLDFLFKPKFGAAMQHVKVEIGGGENSTCGSEATHAVVESEKNAPINRGYEIRLLGEGRARNPKLRTEALAWCYPAWCQTGYYATAKSAEWYLSFIKAVNNAYGFHLDYLSANRNEAYSYDKNWIITTLRPAMNSAGFSDVKFSGPDLDHFCWEIINDLDTSPSFASTMSAISYHYDWDLRERAPNDRFKASGWPLWSGEMHCYRGDLWQNALYFARGVNANYIDDRITNTQVWYGLDAMYPGLLFKGYGAITAESPWSGNYRVNPMAWAYAHTTQFTEIGWKYLDGACGQITPGNRNGTYVALRDPSSANWSMIICTEAAASMTVNIAGGLSAGTVYVWKSEASAQFVQQSGITPANGSFTIALAANSMYTLTTTTGQQKGSRSIPAAKPFPYPYSENYESYAAGAMPRYHSDQKGTFEVSDRPGGGKCLKQIVPAQGLAWASPIKPNTFFGDMNWTNYEIRADVFISAGNVEIGGRWADYSNLGYRFCVAKNGDWWLYYQGRTLTNGTISGFDGNAWHNLMLQFQGNSIQAFLDNARIAQVTDGSCGNGPCFFASTYNPNLFDNLKIGPVGTTRIRAPAAVPGFAGDRLWVRQAAASSRITIRCACRERGPVSLGIYDMRGNLVRSLVNGMHAAGTFETLWDGTDSRGIPAGSDAYVVKFVSNGQTRARIL
jgi:galactosylceramidase